MAGGVELWKIKHLVFLEERVIKFALVMQGKLIKVGYSQLSLSLHLHLLLQLLLPFCFAFSVLLNQPVPN
jgi:hypothetical protein